MPTTLQDQLNAVLIKISETKDLITSLSQDKSNEDLILLANEDLINFNIQKESLESAINPLSYSNEEKKSDTAAPSSGKNCILEIRAGAGGDEAGLFANDLLVMYMRYAEKKGWQSTILAKQEGGIGNIKEVSLEIIGKKNQTPTPFQLLKHETGVHRVQRVPLTESGGRIHTSTATVAVLPIVTGVSVQIKKEDLQIDTYRSGGAGGQHVNTTDSAIRITHKPTGVVVQCQDERSQHKNKERAMNILTSRLYTLMEQQQKSSIDEIRSEQVGTGDRSEKIKTYNFPQDRLTDHRIKKSWHNLEKVLSGEIDNILNESITELNSI